MNINIYYGGRGIIEDPTLYVLKQIEQVFDELHVKFTRYNLYELKNSITTLPQTLKEADGIILAASVEWMGIGGYLQQFLDACWLYGDKSKIASLYMCPVVISTTYGERDAQLTLTNAWELLGGKLCDGICAYVEDSIDFEGNTTYRELIEKKAENVYRTVSKKISGFPSSSNTIRHTFIQNGLELTPQEGEQLSKYVSDDIYVQKQKEDIEELASFFKDILQKQSSSEDEFISLFKNAFQPQPGLYAGYSIIIDDKNTELAIQIEGSSLSVKYEKLSLPDIALRMNSATLDNITHGRSTFQKAFMTGEVTSKGNFNNMRLLDQLFDFQQSEF